MNFEPSSDQTNDETPPLYTRRQGMGLLVKTAIAGMILPTTEASAFFFGGNPAEDYAKYIRSLRLKNISVDEVMMAHAKRRGSVSNSIPPKKLWKNIRATLKVADMAAQKLGTKRVRIISAYRSAAYNARCAGASSGSMHKQNLALDLKYDVSPYRVVSVMRDLRRRGVFKGGIGSYGSFTHVDTRGQNVDW